MQAESPLAKVPEISALKKSGTICARRSGIRLESDLSPARPNSIRFGRDSSCASR